jgi:hypothetical protein
MRRSRLEPFPALAVAKAGTTYLPSSISVIAHAIQHGSCRGLGHEVSWHEGKGEGDNGDPLLMKLLLFIMLISPGGCPA